MKKEEGESDVVSVLKGHTHYVVDLDFGGERDGLVVSCSMDSTLKVIPTLRASTVFVPDNTAE